MENRMAESEYFTTRTSDGKMIVDVEAKMSEFDFRERLREDLLGLVAASPSRLVVNLDRVEMLGSNTIGSFVAARNAVHGSGGKMVLCNVQPNVRLSLQALNLEGTLFEVFDSESDALRAFDCS